MLPKRLGQSAYIYKNYAQKALKNPFLAVSISSGGPSFSLIRNIKSLVSILKYL